MCPTRWVERHDSVLVFIELIKPVLDCLETISEWPDKESSPGANQFLSNLTQPEFLIPMHVTVVAKVFAVNLGLCRRLAFSRKRTLIWFRLWPWQIAFWPF